MAAKGADARQRQTDLIKTDLLLPGQRDGTAAPERWQRWGGGYRPARPELADNLRDLAGLLESSAAQSTALERQRDGLVALRERVQQILGPSILAVADVVGRGSIAPEGLFRQAAVAQGPLLEAERLMGSAFGELLVGATAPTQGRLAQARGTFQRLRDRLGVGAPRGPGRA